MEWDVIILKKHIFQKKLLSPAFFVCALPILIFKSFIAQAQVVNTLSSVDFGSFDFATNYNGRIQLGTNGNVQTTGFGISSNGGETAGHLQVTAPGTGIIDIKCATTATLADPVGTDLTIVNIEIAVNTGVAFGSANACNGLGGGDAIAATIDLDALPTPNIYIGGEIVISTPITLPTDKMYSTTGAGTPIMLSIVTQ